MKPQILNWMSTTLGSFFGIHLQIVYKDTNLYLISHNSELIVFDNINPFFYRCGKTDMGCREWNPIDEGFENILGGSIFSPGLSMDKIFSFTEDIIYCHYDVLGLMFWCFNRLEEVGNPKRDEHDRFSFYESHAYKYNYIEYPIVDQWLDILKQAIKKNNPSIIFRKNDYKVVLTHDVDRPARYYFKELKGFIKASIGDFVKTRSIKNLIKSLSRFTNNDIPDSDPYNTFDWLMTVSEQKNLVSQFYFISGGNSKYDADYDINSQEIKSLIEKIKSRNHEIGLHPSYESYLNKDMISKEFSSLSSVVDISNYRIGGRMHYLRFKYPDTLINLEQVGIKYDSTLGYAEHIGFRCGTSHSYFPFDPLKDRMINILIYPLIVMDGTLSTYMGLDFNSIETYERVAKISKACEIYGGNFVLLWHNSELITSIQKSFYRKLVMNL